MENMFGNQGIPLDWLPFSLFPVEKIARPYGDHILLRYPSFSVRASGARIFTYLTNDMKHKIPVSFRLFRFVSPFGALAKILGRHFITYGQMSLVLAKTKSHW